MASTKDRKHSRASFQFEFQLLIPKAGFLVTMTNRSCKHSRNDCRCFKFGSTRKRWSENGSGTFRVALAFHPGDRQCQLSTYLSIYLPTYLPTYLPIYHFWLYHSHKLHLTHVAEVDGYCPAWLLIFIIKRLNDGDLQASLKVQMY